MSLGCLSERKIQIVNRCSMCQMECESVRHLFLHCAVAADIWSMFLSIFGLSWVMPNTIKEAYESWCSWRVGNPSKTWCMVPTFFWCIWNERNRRYFNGISTPNHILKSNCLVNLFSWFNQALVTTVEPFFLIVSALWLVSKFLYKNRHLLLL